MHFRCTKWRVYSHHHTNDGQERHNCGFCPACANFGKLLSRVDDERRSLILEKRGRPKAVLLSIRDYVKLAAPEPEVLRVVGEESEQNGTSALTSREIDKIIKASRSQKSKR